MIKRYLLVIQHCNGKWWSMNIHHSYYTCGRFPLPGYSERVRVVSSIAIGFWTNAHTYPYMHIFTIAADKIQRVKQCENVSAYAMRSAKKICNICNCQRNTDAAAWFFVIQGQSQAVPHKMLGNVGLQLWASVAFNQSVNAIFWIWYWSWNPPTIVG